MAQKKKSKSREPERVSSKLPYISQKVLKNFAIAIGGLLGAFLALTQIIDWFLINFCAYEENIQIVFDSSIRMEEPFENSTKLQIARSTLISRVLYREITKKTNLSLRQFGGDCQDLQASTKLRIDFDQDNINEIRDSLTQIKPRGEPTLVRGMLEAVADLDDLDKRRFFKKKAIVISASADHCSGTFNEKLSGVRRQIIDGDTIVIDLNLVGLGLTTSEEDELREIARSTGGEFFTPHSQGELERYLQSIFTGRPAIGVADQLTSYFDTVYDSLAAAMKRLNQRDYQGAEKMTLIARNYYYRIDFTLGYLSEKLNLTRTKGQIQPYYRAAYDSHQILMELLDLVKDAVTQARNEQNDIYNSVKTQWNGLARTYNDKLIEMNKHRQNL